jgi:hypothetical protein
VGWKKQLGVGGRVLPKSLVKGWLVERIPCSVPALTHCCRQGGGVSMWRLPSGKFGDLVGGRPRCPRERAEGGLDA